MLDSDIGKHFIRGGCIDAYVIGGKYGGNNARHVKPADADRDDA